MESGPSRPAFRPRSTMKSPTPYTLITRLGCSYMAQPSLLPTFLTGIPLLARQCHLQRIATVPSSNLQVPCLHRVSSPTRPSQLPCSLTSYQFPIISGLYLRPKNAPLAQEKAAARCLLLPDETSSSLCAQIVLLLSSLTPAARLLSRPCKEP